MKKGIISCKQVVIKTHQWLGLSLSLLFVVWFLSGFFMMYVPFPTMKQNERLQHLPVLNLEQCKISPVQAVLKANILDTVNSIRLGMLKDRPVYRIAPKHLKPLVVFADNGERLQVINARDASQIASAFMKYTCKPRRVEALNEIDQWMAGHKGQGYLPDVFRMEMDDEASTYLYVSIYTGEVVQMVNARQRLLAWFGPIPHWIYPAFLIRNRPLWSQLVISMSLLGTIMCLSGIILGLIRFKRKETDKLRFSPFKKKWFKWHHYTGFIFGVFVFTWVLSGLFSMSPLNWAPSKKLNDTERDSWTGGSLQAQLFSLTPINANQLFSSSLKVKEIHLIQFQGKPYYLAFQDDFHTRLLSANGSVSFPFRVFSVRNLLSAISKLCPSHKIVEQKVLKEYDNYYYSKGRDKRLPVLRVKFDNPSQIWYYADPKTGEIALKYEQRSRSERWLYHGLHSLDFRLLQSNRPLWDFVLIFLLLGGLIVSLTGLVLTWKWIVKRK